MTSEALIQATRNRIATVLNAKFPNVIDFGDGSYAVPHGSSSVAVLVRPYTETDTMVELIAQIVSGADVTSDVMHWMLRKNAELHFGAFGLLFDNTIVYTYAIPGVHVDSEELEAAITSVAIIADHYDDEIVKMAGGKRAADL